jgi:DNA-binding NarL/FixJ family response regulator
VTRLRAFLVEDSPLVIETLSAALEEMAGVQFVGRAITEEEALSRFGSRTHECDVAIS